ncbi:hypothetical protein Tco_1411448, partial [Tanacetum coccineum]
LKQVTNNFTISVLQDGKHHILFFNTKVIVHKFFKDFKVLVIFLFDNSDSAWCSFMPDLDVSDDAFPSEIERESLEILPLPMIFPLNLLPKTMLPPSYALYVEERLLFPVIYLEQLLSLILSSGSGSQAYLIK